MSEHRKQVPGDGVEFDSSGVLICRYLKIKCPRQKRAPAGGLLLHEKGSDTILIFLECTKASSSCSFTSGRCEIFALKKMMLDFKVLPYL